MALVVVLFPSSVVAVMVKMPATTPATSPLLFTVATVVLLELQLTVLLVAFDGEIVADICFVPFT